MLQIFSKTTHFDFMRWHKVMIALSVLMMVVTAGLLYQKGLNLGTDFSGGILIEVETAQDANVAELRKQLDNLGLGTVNIQEFGSADRVLIRLGQQGSEEQQQAAVDKVRGVVGEDANYRRVEFVGPQVGAELIKRGIMAVVISSVAILIYIMARFQWQFGLSCVLALLHDTFLTMGLFALTRAEFDLSTLAAVLMIAGYSINDTVVVFDRLRENMRKYRKMPMKDLINHSVNSTLSRTILTGGTTIMALVVLYTIGGDVIKGLVGALIWGIIVGTYSSIFVAAPILIYMGLKDNPATQNDQKA